jgi:hypothetical protein
MGGEETSCSYTVNGKPWTVGRGLRPAGRCGSRLRTANLDPAGGTDDGETREGKGDNATPTCGQSRERQRAADARVAARPRGKAKRRLEGEGPPEPRSPGHAGGYRPPIEIEGAV